MEPIKIYTLGYGVGGRMFLRAPLQEEEEWGGGAGGGYYYHSDLRNPDQWWRDIESAAPKFPLYAVF